MILDIILKSPKSASLSLSAVNLPARAYRKPIFGASQLFDLLLKAINGLAASCKPLASDLNGTFFCLRNDLKGHRLQQIDLRQAILAR